VSRRIHKPVFCSRSALPTSAACVVANGVRETLASLFGMPVELLLVEPSIPPPSAWVIILKGAVLYRVRGKVADAAIVLRSPDALALTTGLFGERQSVNADRELSPIERDVLDRTMSAIAAHLSSVCGTREGRGVERVATIQGYASYFELLLEKPVMARIGFSLSREPSLDTRTHVEFGHLATVLVTASVTLDLGMVPSRAVTRLQPGTLVYLRPSDLQRCVLSVHGRDLAHGKCGVTNGHYALRVEIVREPA
jgi:hypothetical protein